VINWREDGRTHINIYSRGQTDLGRMLSTFTAIPEGGLIYTDDGLFKSVESYAKWLVYRHPRLYTMTGREAYEFASYLGQGVFPRDYQEKVIKALDYKFKASKMIREALAANELPLEMYIVVKGRVYEAIDMFVLDFWRGK